ncbi:putative zinc-binding metallopeptidase, partial [Azohydromonas lata]|uniref:putative zinc-binding metallopeptidase n=1 Tax=Azohydromonas lata TaxID=45677 RepID=UPI00157C2CE3
MAATSRAWQCSCGHEIYFRNSECLGCGAPLGYLASRGALLALQPGPRKDTWQLRGSSSRAPVYRRCANFPSPPGCNWLVEAGARGQRTRLCQACALNQCVPDLSRAGELVLWTRMERAKRRLVSQLIGLGLPVVSKVRDDPARGLAFDFPSPSPGRPRVMTGHGNGVITIK